MKLMMRSDEQTAWEGFLAAAPRFADEAVNCWADGPDPPDVLCCSDSDKTIGVELTKWVEHNQVTSGAGREKLEKGYLEIIASEKVPKPDHIRQVLLYDRSSRIAQSDQAKFRKELYAFLAAENAKPLPVFDPHLQITADYRKTVCSWHTLQGAPVNDFSAYPVLEKYLEKIWIYPSSNSGPPLVGDAWIEFELPGGAYTAQWMMQAAVDRICQKICNYQKKDIRSQHTLDEFDLLCYYCDEAIRHNTPTHSIGYGFPELAEQVKKQLKNSPKVFDRVFLFHPYNDPKAIRVY
ncbi:MAG TPA: hypothetical protein VFI20_08975 [Terracidiphilus sp.]|nr:hypothetical protein [Terracidiphilus sp.]